LSLYMENRHPRWDYSLRVLGESNCAAALPHQSEVLINSAFLVMRTYYLWFCLLFAASCSLSTLWL